MNIDVSNLHPSSNLLMKNVPKEKEVKNPDGSTTTLDDSEWDVRGFKEQTGAEIFNMVVDGAIKGANQRVSFDQLKGLRKVAKTTADAVKVGNFIANKTEIDIIKNSIRGNQNWPNTDPMFDVLEKILDKLDNAENINENPTADTQGADSK